MRFLTIKTQTTNTGVSRMAFLTPGDQVKFIWNNWEIRKSKRSKYRMPCKVLPKGKLKWWRPNWWVNWWNRTVITRGFAKKMHETTCVLTLFHDAIYSRPFRIQVNCWIWAFISYFCFWERLKDKLGIHAQWTKCKEREFEIQAQRQWYELD